MESGSGVGAGGATEFVVDSAKIADAKSQFIATGQKYKDLGVAIETSLNTIAEQAWPTVGPAKEEFVRKVALIKEKIAAVNSFFEKNVLIFDKVEQYATAFEQKMTGHISSMAA